MSYMENLMSDQIDAGIHLMESIYEELETFEIAKLEEIENDSKIYCQDKGYNESKVSKMARDVLTSKNHK